MNYQITPPLDENSRKLTAMFFEGSGNYDYQIYESRLKPLRSSLYRDMASLNRIVENIVKEYRRKGRIRATKPVRGLFGSSAVDYSEPENYEKIITAMESFLSQYNISRIVSITRGMGNMLILRNNLNQYVAAIDRFSFCFGIKSSMFINMMDQMTQDANVIFQALPKYSKFINYTAAHLGVASFA